MWRQPQCLWTSEWIKRMWPIHKMQYYLASKKEGNPILHRNTNKPWVSWMNLMFHEIRFPYFFTELFHLFLLLLAPPCLIFSFSFQPCPYHTGRAIKTFRCWDVGPRATPAPTWPILLLLSEVVQVSEKHRALEFRECPSHRCSLFLSDFSPSNTRGVAGTLQRLVPVLTSQSAMLLTPTGL